MFFRLTIMEVGIVEIVIVPVVRSLSNATATKNQYFIETPVLRPEGIIITKMPFTKNARCITAMFKKPAPLLLLLSAKALFQLSYATHQLYYNFYLSSTRHGWVHM